MIGLAYLEVARDVDYVQGPMIAQGGGGILFECIPLSKKLETGNDEEKLIMKIVCQNLEELKPRSQRAFFQEWGIMARYRNQPAFCQVYGYSASNPV